MRFKYAAAPYTIVDPSQKACHSTSFSFYYCYYLFIVDQYTFKKE